MTTKEAAELYQRSGFAPPPSIAAPSAEYVRNTRRKVVDGIEFRSTLEATAYQVLASWQAAGAISKLELQPRFVLQPSFISNGERIRAMHYTADFRFEQFNPMTEQVETWVVEAKGHRTESYRMRRKMFLAKFPGLVFVEWNRETVKSLTQR